MVKSLMVTLWPEVLQWSWIGEEDFWWSLNLSAKVLADSPIYSSSHPSSLHLYLYITPLLLVIGSLSFGGIRRPLMVWPPLKCTCTPYFLQVFSILSLSPCWYWTIMYKFLLLLLFWPVCLTNMYKFLLLLLFWPVCLFLFQQLKQVKAEELREKSSWFWRTYNPPNLILPKRKPKQYMKWRKTKREEYWLQTRGIHGGHGQRWIY